MILEKQKDLVSPSLQIQILRKIILHPGCFKPISKINQNGQMEWSSDFPMWSYVSPMPKGEQGWKAQ